jgi:hypothetical protein
MVIFVSHFAQIYVFYIVLLNMAPIVWRIIVPFLVDGMPIAHQPLFDPFSHSLFHSLLVHSILGWIHSEGVESTVHPKYGHFCRAKAMCPIGPTNRPAKLASLKGLGHGDVAMNVFGHQ